MKIKLTPDGNHYRATINGRLADVPRVTHILKTLKLIWVPDDPAALALGSATHAAIHYLLEDRLDLKSVDDLVRPRLAAAQKFMQQMDVKPIAIERPIASNLGYAGTPDLICSFGGNGKERAVVDFKCSTSVQAAAGLQLVAYAGGSSATPIGRFVCLLLPDGEYKLAVFPASAWYGDWRAWLGCLSLYAWVMRQKKGKKE